ncbi:hypothetical protein [Nonomuraea jiangxiensis]|uniref:Uncharacterized protein n=1 Tax=Nonomuraea jiangxiensis TaxID=633440 RepID=A0A1G8XTK8_9ACTN|nr:hypothetical protein [Nonomuraea jiangxiensis]SDJ93504.1 hypothetical protein SAMN05421869_11362 [Nonomuraea jiangxiensis]
MTEVHDRRALLLVARVLVFRAAVGLVLVLAILGHVLVLLLGALDALVTAWLGLPRLSRFSRQFVEVVRETWREER